MIVTCSKCGETLNLTEHLFKMNAEAALIELLFAQMARIFRREFDIAYATEGETDVDALRVLMQSYKEKDDGISPASLTEIGEAWGGYLRKNGSNGTVQDFVYNWPPDESGDASRVIPFRPRP